MANSVADETDNNPLSILGFVDEISARRTVWKELCLYQGLFKHTSIRESNLKPETSYAINDSGILGCQSSSFTDALEKDM